MALLGGKLEQAVYCMKLCPLRRRPLLTKFSCYLLRNWAAGKIQRSLERCKKGKKHDSGQVCGKTNACAREQIMMCAHLFPAHLLFGARIAHQLGRKKTNDSLQTGGKCILQKTALRVCYFPKVFIFLFHSPLFTKENAFLLRQFTFFFWSS